MWTSLKFDYRKPLVAIMATIIRAGTRNTVTGDPASLQDCVNEAKEIFALAHQTEDEKESDEE